MKGLLRRPARATSSPNWHSNTENPPPAVVVIDWNAKVRDNFLLSDK
jgi:hypothetical protein